MNDPHVGDRVFVFPTDAQAMQYLSEDPYGVISDLNFRATVLSPARHPLYWNVKTDSGQHMCLHENELEPIKQPEVSWPVTFAFVAGLGLVLALIATMIH